MIKLYAAGLFFFLLSFTVSIYCYGQNPQNGITVAGLSVSPANEPSFLNSPRGIQVDAAGNLYIADHLNKRVQKYTPGSTVGRTVAPLSSTLLTTPGDIFVDASGVIYVSDDLGTRILKYVPGEADGKLIIQAVNSTTFVSPLGISVDASGNVYFVDGRARVLKYPPSASVYFTQGEIVGSSAGRADYHDVFVDVSGNIFAADAYNNQILKFTPPSTVGVVVAGGNGAGSAPNQFDRPEGIFVDSAGNIFVADFNNNRVQKWRPGATEGVTAAGGNGAGSAANQLKNPWSVEIDKAGNLFVSDNGNNRVQKFTLNNGLAHQYYEGNFTTLPDFSTLTPVKTGLSANTDLSVRTPGRNDQFAFVWNGYIRIPAPGIYTFETASDDGSKIYFNSTYNPAATPTVNNDGIHSLTSATGNVYIAAAGTYPFSVTYFEKDGGENMQLYWSVPGFGRQPIPDGAFTQTPSSNIPVPSPNTLSYKYYEGGFNSLPDFSSLTPVKTGSSANFDLGVRRSGVNDSFAIVWDGFINIPAEGTYSFETISDDGSKFYFNNTLVVNNDGTHPAKSVEGFITINTPGTYPVRLEYFENFGGENLLVYWKSRYFDRQLIPDAAFRERVQLPANGLNNKFYLGDFDVLPDFNNLKAIRTGIVPNVTNMQGTSGEFDHYASIWQGYINLPSAGTYTFETISDDGSKVYFNTPYAANANSLVNNDGLHAANSVKGDVTVFAPGLYPITITYFEKTGGQVMELYWSGPGISRQLVPDVVFSPTGPALIATGGLNYKYYEADLDNLPDFNALVPVKTGTSNNVDLSVRAPGRDDYYAVLWQGYIHIPLPGLYNFETVSDDGSKLYFNMTYDPAAAATVNNDGIHPSASATGQVNIDAAGWYPITISFFEKYGGEKMEVYWSGPGFPRQLIPNEAFSTTMPFMLTSIAAVNNMAGNLNESVSVNRIYPNPFRESFHIDFYNSSASNDVQVGIYDMKGRLMYNLNKGTAPAGNISLLIKPETRTLPEGVYVAILRINGMPSKTVKLVRVK